MSLRTEVEAILQAMEIPVSRPPEAAIAIGAHNIFQVVGGPVWLTSLIAYANEATGAASSFQITACGVVLENAAVVCNLLVGEMAVWPLVGGAGNIIVPNVANTPYMPLASVLLGMVGGAMLSPGSAGGDMFVLTVGAADTVGATSFHLRFKRMSPNSNIIPV